MSCSLTDANVSRGRWGMRIRPGLSRALRSQPLLHDSGRGHDPAIVRRLRPKVRLQHGMTNQWLRSESEPLVGAQTSGGHAGPPGADARQGRQHLLGHERLPVPLRVRWCELEPQPGASDGPRSRLEGAAPWRHADVCRERRAAVEANPRHGSGRIVTPQGVTVARGGGLRGARAHSKQSSAH
eukprot:COSAG04_NODE_173_length_21572_cov_104.574256_3_plen_183_part_00